MDAADFVYMQIYKGAINSGSTERASLDAATTGTEDWRRNRFSKASALIKGKIQEAKKNSKTERKGVKHDR